MTSGIRSSTKEIDLTQLTSASDALTPAYDGPTNVLDLNSRLEMSAFYIKEMGNYAQEAFLHTRIC
jgi:hypothetical protein